MLRVLGLAAALALAISAHAQTVYTVCQATAAIPSGCTALATALSAASNLSTPVQFIFPDTDNTYTIETGSATDLDGASAMYHLPAQVTIVGSNATIGVVSTSSGDPVPDQSLSFISFTPNTTTGEIGPISIANLYIVAHDRAYALVYQLDGGAVAARTSSANVTSFILTGGGVSSTSGVCYHAIGIAHTTRAQENQCAAGTSAACLPTGNTRTVQQLQLQTVKFSTFQGSPVFLDSLTAIPTSPYASGWSYTGATLTSTAGMFIDMYNSLTIATSAQFVVQNTIYITTGQQLAQLQDNPGTFTSVLLSNDITLNPQEFTRLATYSSFIRLLDGSSVMPAATTGTVTISMKDSFAKLNSSLDIVRFTGAGASMKRIVLSAPTDPLAMVTSLVRVIGNATDIEFSTFSPLCAQQAIAVNAPFYGLVLKNNTINACSTSATFTPPVVFTAEYTASGTQGALLRYNTFQPSNATVLNNAITWLSFSAVCNGSHCDTTAEEDTALAGISVDATYNFWAAEESTLSRTVGGLAMLPSCTDASCNMWFPVTFIATGASASLRTPAAAVTLTNVFAGAGTEGLVIVTGTLHISQTYVISSPLVLVGLPTVYAMPRIVVDDFVAPAFDVVGALLSISSLAVDIAATGGLAIIRPPGSGMVSQEQSHLIRIAFYSASYEPGVGITAFDADTFGVPDLAQEVLLNCVVRGGLFGVIVQGASLFRADRAVSTQVYINSAWVATQAALVAAIDRTSYPPFTTTNVVIRNTAFSGTSTAVYADSSNGTTLFNVIATDTVANPLTAGVFPIAFDRSTFGVASNVFVDRSLGGIGMYASTNMTVAGGSLNVGANGGIISECPDAPVIPGGSFALYCGQGNQPSTAGKAACIAFLESGMYANAMAWFEANGAACSDMIAANDLNATYVTLYNAYLSAPSADVITFLDTMNGGHTDSWQTLRTHLAWWLATCKANPLANSLFNMNNITSDDIVHADTTRTCAWFYQANVNCAQNPHFYSDALSATCTSSSMLDLESVRVYYTSATAISTALLSAPNATAPPATYDTSGLRSDELPSSLAAPITTTTATLQTATNSSMVVSESATVPGLLMAFWQPPRRASTVIRGSSLVLDASLSFISTRPTDTFEVVFGENLFNIQTSYNNTQAACEKLRLYRQRSDGSVYLSNLDNSVANRVETSTFHDTTAYATDPDECAFSATVDRLSPFLVGVEPGIVSVRQACNQIITNERCFMTLSDAYTSLFSDDFANRLQLFNGTYVVHDTMRFYNKPVTVTCMTPATTNGSVYTPSCTVICGNTTDTAIFIDSGANGTAVYGIRFQGCVKTAINVDSQSSLSGEPVTNIIIANNKFENNGQAVRVGQAVGTYVANNIVSNSLSDYSGTAFSLEADTLPGIDQYTPYDRCNFFANNTNLGVQIGYYYSTPAKPSCGVRGRRLAVASMCISQDTASDVLTAVSSDADFAFSTLNVSLSTFSSCGGITNTQAQLLGYVIPFGAAVMGKVSQMIATNTTFNGACNVDITAANVNFDGLRMSSTTSLTIQSLLPAHMHRCGEPDFDNTKIMQNSRVEGAINIMVEGRGLKYKEERFTFGSNNQFDPAQLAGISFADRASRGLRAQILDATTMRATDSSVPQNIDFTPSADLAGQFIFMTPPPGFILGTDGLLQLCPDGTYADDLQRNCLSCVQLVNTACSAGIQVQCPYGFVPDNVTHSQCLQRPTVDQTADLAAKVQAQVNAWVGSISSATDPVARDAASSASASAATTTTWVMWVSIAGGSILFLFVCFFLFRHRAARWYAAKRGQPYGYERIERKLRR